MAYSYASNAEVKEMKSFCTEVFLDVQKEVQQSFTFDFKLIGSGGKHLVTHNDNQPFDLDYNIIIQKDKQELIKNPRQIKSIFYDAFEKVFSEYVNGFDNDGYAKLNNSTSMITLKHISKGKIEFSFDVAIMRKNKNGYLERIIFDKNTGNYIWNIVKQSGDIYKKANIVKKQCDWNEVRDKYLELKNHYLSTNQDMKSFAIYTMVINEFYQTL